MKYNLVGTKIGRFSSKDPNTTILPRIRETYKDRYLDKWSVPYYDYSNVEMTLLKSFPKLEAFQKRVSEMVADLDKRISALEKQFNIKDTGEQIHDERVYAVMVDFALDIPDEEPLYIEPGKSFKVDLGRPASSKPNLQNLPFKFEPISCQCQLKVLMSNGCQCGGA